jgi:hypothetical protein
VGEAVWRRLVRARHGGVGLLPTGDAGKGAVESSALWKRLALQLEEPDEECSLVADAIAGESRGWRGAVRGPRRSRGDAGALGRRRAPLPTPLPPASSTDNHPQEGVANLLTPRSRPPPGLAAAWAGGATYWSSAGSPDPLSAEWVALRLVHPLCVVRTVTVRPFQAFFQGGAPVYAPRTVSTRVGGGAGGGAAGWLWESEPASVAPTSAPQTLPLTPAPALAPGGRLDLHLAGRTAVQDVDGLWYTCLAHVAVGGRALRGLALNAAGALAALPRSADPLAAAPLSHLSERGRPARVAARRAAAAAAGRPPPPRAADEASGSEPDDPVPALGAPAGGALADMLGAVVAAFGGGLPGAGGPPGGHAHGGGGG